MVANRVVWGPIPNREPLVTGRGFSISALRGQHSRIYRPSVMARRLAVPERTLAARAVVMELSEPAQVSARVFSTLPF